MSEMLNKLKQYFKQTSREQVQSDWQEVVEQCAQINSPLVSQFIEQNFHYHFHIPDNYTQEGNSKQTKSELYSDFFIFVNQLINNKCKKQLSH